MMASGTVQGGNVDSAGPAGHAEDCPIAGGDVTRHPHASPLPLPSCAFPPRPTRSKGASLTSGVTVIHPRTVSVSSPPSGSRASTAGLQSSKVSRFQLRARQGAHACTWPAVISSHLPHSPHSVGSSVAAQGTDHREASWHLPSSRGLRELPPPRPPQRQQRAPAPSLPFSASASRSTSPRSLAGQVLERRGAQPPHARRHVLQRGVRHHGAHGRLRRACRHATKRLVLSSPPTCSEERLSSRGASACGCVLGARRRRHANQAAAATLAQALPRHAVDRGAAPAGACGALSPLPVRSVRSVRRCLRPPTSCARKARRPNKTPPQVAARPILNG